MTATRYVKCPKCGAQVAWTAASHWRPFCSERCKVIDLGAWASERYRVAAVEPPDEDGQTRERGPAPRDD